MSRTSKDPIRSRLRHGLLAMCVVLANGVMAIAAPPAPTDVIATDRPWDGGGVAKVTWTAPEVAGLEGFQVWRSWTEGETAAQRKNERLEVLQSTRATAYKNEYDRLVNVEGIAPEDAAAEANKVADLALNQASLGLSGTDGTGDAVKNDWTLVDTVEGSVTSLVVPKLDPLAEYTFVVRTIVKDDTDGIVYSERSAPSTVVIAEAASLNLTRAPLFFVLALLCGLVLFFILWARSGKVLKIRTIAGLAAVDEAVGRATEMGRPMLYVNGILDMDDLQTVAGVTVLGRVAKTAAEYDARIEIPTARSLVMSAARETVEASYLTAGRSDAYNPDLIYYVTDEQFGYTAYVSGLIVRDKPAACFYMGAFFAESLILAETGNSVGAIQIAGTAMPSQLPFFVAACDYTLIGEEFFAASAYLSGQPEQLGSLKGQDVGKILVGLVLIIGVTVATIGAATGNETLLAAVDWFNSTVLTG
ncbi:MAG: fibronectin type III domain-containing protein [Phycisphaera sp.]|nr:fibronectin type III domain-containing protein [Phycisphaera sp.]